MAEQLSEAKSYLRQTFAAVFKPLDDIPEGELTAEVVARLFELQKTHIHHEGDSWELPDPSERGVLRFSRHYSSRSLWQDIQRQKNGDEEVSSNLELPSRVHSLPLRQIPDPEKTA